MALLDDIQPRPERPAKPDTPLNRAHSAVMGWARHVDETVVVFATKSGSSYVVQTSPHDGFKFHLRQLEGDTLARFSGEFSPFYRIGRAYSEVGTRKIHMVVKSHRDGAEPFSITTSPQVTT